MPSEDQILAASLSPHEIDVSGEQKAPKPKVANWRNTPTVEILKNMMLAAASDHNNHVTKKRYWKDLRLGKIIRDRGRSSNVSTSNPYGTTSNARRPNTINKSRIQPKLVKKLEAWRIASLSDPLLSAPNLIKCNPVTWEDAEAARQNQLILNDQFNNKLDRVSFINEYVRRTVEDAVSIVMPHWVTETKTITRRVPTYEVRPAGTDRKLLTVLETLLAMEQDRPRAFYSGVPAVWREAVQMTIEQGIPYAPHIIGYAEVRGEEQIKNKPDLEFIDSSDFWLDPAAKGHIEKARYACYRYRTTIPELEAANKYVNLNLLKRNEVNTTSESEVDSDLVSPDEERDFLKQALGQTVVVYSYWGQWDTTGKGNYVPVVCEFVGDTIIRMEENPYPDKFLPFVKVVHTPVTGSAFGENDAELIGDNQRVVGANVRGMIDLMSKTVSGQEGMRQDALDLLNQKRFLAGQRYFFNPAMGDPATNIYTHKFPEFPQSASQLLTYQISDAEEMTGVRPFKGADNSENGNTKSQNQGKSPLDAAAKRDLDILRRLTTGLEQLAKMLMAMNKEFLSDEEIVRVTNEEFVAIKRDALHGEIDVKVEVTTPEEDHARASELAFMLQTLGQEIGDNTRNHLMAEIATLRRMPALADSLRNMPKDVSEEEQARIKIMQEEHQMKMQLLQAQIQTEQAKAAQLGSQVPLNQAKTGTEQAKANLLDSQADIYDQDFVSKDSTDDYAQRTALQQAQSEGNIQLEKTKFQLREQEKNNDLQREYARSVVSNALRTRS